MNYGGRKVGAAAVSSAATGSRRFIKLPSEEADVSNEEERSSLAAQRALVRARRPAGQGIFGLYPATDEKNLAVFAEWRKAKGR